MLSLFLALAADPPAVVPPEPDPNTMPDTVQPTLDGRVYAVMVQDPTQGLKPETFLFADGLFDARESHQLGFVAGPYTVLAREGSLAFSATLKSPTNGEITWTGTVAGDTISGSAEWRRPGKNRVHYAFDGALRK